MATKHLVEVLGDNGWFSITGEELTFVEATQTAQAYTDSFRKMTRVVEVRRKVRWSSRKPANPPLVVVSPEESRAA